jgi:hypothetical protein
MKEEKFTGGPKTDGGGDSGGGAIPLLTLSIASENVVS